MPSIALLKLYRLPITLTAMAAVAWVLFAWVLPSFMDDHVLAVSLAAAFRETIAPILSLFLLLCAGVSALHQVYELWQWERGNRPSCYSCGGPVTILSGRFGPYIRCQICGRKRSGAD